MHHAIPIIIAENLHTIFYSFLYFASDYILILYFCSCYSLRISRCHMLKIGHFQGSAFLVVLWTNLNVCLICLELNQFCWLISYNIEFEHCSKRETTFYDDLLPYLLILCCLSGSLKTLSIALIGIEDVVLT